MPAGRWRARWARRTQEKRDGGLKPELVILGFAIVVGDAPLGGDVAFLLEFEEGGVEGAVIDGEEVAAGLLDAAGDAIAVERAESLQSLQDHQGQGALPDVRF